MRVVAHRDQPVNTPAPLSFRLASAGDLSDISDIEARAHSHPWPDATLLWSITQPSVLACLAVQEQRVIGYAFIEQVLDEATLLNITIDPAHQQRGHGKTLLQHALSQLPPTTQRTVLEVRTSNHAAKQLYATLGFTTIATRKRYYPTDTGREDALVMERVLR